MKSRYDLGNGKISNEDQKLATDLMIDFLHSDEKEFILEGKAGTGKTTIIKKVIEYYNNNLSDKGMFSNNIAAAAVSHAAKNVLRKSMGNTFVNVYTLAKLLGMMMNINEEGQIEFIPETKTWKKSPPPIKGASLLIIDEASNISKYLLSLIREHRLINAKTIFMGDIHQLPPIDKHREEDEDSDTFKLNNKAKLNKRMRQAEHNPIIKLSDIYADNLDRFIETGNFLQKPLLTKYRKDIYNPITGEGILFPKKVSETFKMMLKDFERGKELRDPNYVKAIAFRNKNPYGTAPYNISSINLTVRKNLWKSEEEYVQGEIVVANNPYIQEREVLIQNGDSMIVVDNYIENYNGVECCILTLLTSNNSHVYEIPVVSKLGKREYFNKLKSLANIAKKKPSEWKKFYDFKQSFADISYGYAITAHKAQGSGYNNVYIFEDDIMEVKKTTYKEKQQCMYTAITRAMNKCVIFSKKYN